MAISVKDVKIRLLGKIDVSKPIDAFCSVEMFTAFTKMTDKQRAEMWRFKTAPLKVTAYCNSNNQLPNNTIYLMQSDIGFSELLQLAMNKSAEEVPVVVDNTIYVSGFNKALNWFKRLLV